MTELNLDAYRRIGAPLTPARPSGPVCDAWETRRSEMRLVNPANRRRFRVIVVGTGLAGAGCASALGELGYEVDVLTFHDSSRRAHSVAAQGGVNAAKAYKADGDSVERFFRDTVRGGDFRARETDVYRMSQLSTQLIDQFVALGTPFAREYGGGLATRSFGGVQVSRTFYARSQTGQQLQLAAHQALQRQVDAGTCCVHARHEVLDIIVDDGAAVGVVARDLTSGEIRPFTAHAVVLATGGSGNVYFASTLAKASNVTAAWRAHRRGALLANPSFIQFHPTSLPIDDEWQSKTTLMSESLRNDGRIWVPERSGDVREPRDIPEAERDYYLERMYPAYGNLAPRDVASRAAKAQLDAGRGVGPLHNGVYLDFADAFARLGDKVVDERYGNLFRLYADATGEDPKQRPMRIAPGPHFSMGGLWVDYDLMTSIPGLFVGGEANFAVHGANRLGANSLLSASIDGWFILPNTVANYLAPRLKETPMPVDHQRVRRAVDEAADGVKRLLNVGGSTRPDVFHRRLGAILASHCGVARNQDSLLQAIDEIRGLREDFWTDVKVLGTGDHLNQELERAGRISDFLELGELMCTDAVDRNESCGAHFRTEHQTDDGEADRNDEDWMSISAWEHGAHNGPPIRHSEPLDFTAVQAETRSYR